MKNNLIVLALSFICLTSNVLAQLEEKVVSAKLKQHITTLASDEYQGRETGQPGEKMAYEYIVKQYQEIGLLPKGTDKYIQAFPFTKEIKMGEKNKLTLGKEQLTPGTMFYPLGYSANAEVKGTLVNVGFGINAPGLNYNDYANKSNLSKKIFVIEISTPDSGGPHSKYADISDLRSRIDTAISKGAAGIIFINSNKDEKDPETNYSNRITPSKIPVIFVKEEQISKLKDGVNVAITAEIIKIESIGHNVLGFIDNGAKNTVVIGAHYDHLGMGDDGSLYRGEPAIHNGADDNASGTGGLIELARYLKANGPSTNNYLFMAYSGEEKGLLGSGYWTKNPTLKLNSINYMLNMDMIGRLKPEDQVLLVNGVGTSDAWKITMNYIHIDSMKVKTTESGIGPSDHTSFYLKDIPVLHFFSGTHSNYHRPSDDEALINYNGEIKILNYMIQLVQRLDDKGKLTFVKTKEENNEDAPRFKVTLGVVPDYAFEGSGMRIDGVTEGKPASKAGLKTGDIVTKLGENTVVDMMSYMKALGKFTKGEKTIVTYIRDKAEQKVELEF
jgi:hypothetical protein